MGGLQRPHGFVDDPIVSLVQAYRSAKALVIEAGYAEEIGWQAKRNLDALTEQEFLTELAWVVLCSGMKVEVVQKKFPYVREAFFNFKSARMIEEYEFDCVDVARQHFNNVRKLQAIAAAARQLAMSGWPKVKQSIREDPLNRLSMFPFIGPITVYHLAKNVGVQVAKPDRHLVRIAQAFGYDDAIVNRNASVQKFCRDVGDATGDSVPVVDLVWWRYATINPDYLDAINFFKTTSYSPEPVKGVSSP